MEDLQNAIQIIEKYNLMPFEEFCKKCEDYFNVKITETAKQNFKYMGLNNKDFFEIAYNVCINSLII